MGRPGGQAQILRDVSGWERFIQGIPISDALLVQEAMLLAAAPWRVEDTLLDSEQSCMHVQKNLVPTDEATYTLDI